MFGSVFGKSFNSAKCKTLLKLAMSRIKLLRNKRDIQVKQMRRDLAQLLQTCQEPSARIRVEHVIREQNIMAAYEIIELFCELIVVRLPIIESQRQCPIDLREAVASLIFAAPRCADLPELLQIRDLFSAKYGKEFVAAAAELRPDCGVNRRVIEKLSVRAPTGEVKLKMMKEIAAEHNMNWDPTESEEELLKVPEDLLEGPSHFVGASQISMPGPAKGDLLPDSRKLADQESFKAPLQVNSSMPHAPIPHSASSLRASFQEENFQEGKQFIPSVSYAPQDFGSPNGKNLTLQTAKGFKTEVTEANLQSGRGKFNLEDQSLHSRSSGRHAETRDANRELQAKHRMSSNQSCDRVEGPSFKMQEGGYHSFSSRDYTFEGGNTKDYKGVALGRYHSFSSPRDHNFEKSNKEDYKDAVAAALAAQKAAEHAAEAAEAAASLANKRHPGWRSNQWVPEIAMKPSSESEDNRRVWKSQGRPEIDKLRCFSDHHHVSEKPLFYEDSKIVGSRRSGRGYRTRHETSHRKGHLSSSSDDSSPGDESPASPTNERTTKFHLEDYPQNRKSQNNDEGKHFSASRISDPSMRSEHEPYSPRFDESPTNLSQKQEANGETVTLSTSADAASKPPQRPPPSLPKFGQTLFQHSSSFKTVSVHPKLPDYDDLAARFEALKSRR